MFENILNLFLVICFSRDECKRWNAYELLENVTNTGAYTNINNTQPGQFLKNFKTKHILNISFRSKGVFEALYIISHDLKNTLIPIYPLYLSSYIVMFWDIFEVLGQYKVVRSTYILTQFISSQLFIITRGNWLSITCTGGKRKKYLFNP